MRTALKQKLLAFTLCFAMIITTLSYNKINVEAETITEAPDNRTPTTVEYNYTGNYQSFTAPYTGTYTIEVWGSKGGDDSGYVGGNGGYVKATYKMTANQTIYIYVGNHTSTTWNNSGYQGCGYADYSYNGGGGAYSVTPNTDVSQHSQYAQPTGGGATDIRTVAGAWWDNLDKRILIAAGGGAAGHNEYSGAISTNGSSVSKINGVPGKGSQFNNDYEGGGGGGGYNGGQLGYAGSNYLDTNVTGLTKIAAGYDTASGAYGGYGKCVITFPQANVNYKDVDINTNTLLGSGTWNYKRNVGATVRGSEKGSDTTVGAYYPNYYYVSDTSATVSEDIIVTVYRYFNNQYPVKVIDKVGNTSGTTLGTTSLGNKTYGTTVKGSEIGSDTSVGAYYTGYKYDSCSTTTVGTSETIVYRFFKAAQYTITYNGNGATSGSTASQTKDYGASINIRSNGFTKTGYSFTGWNTKADGTGTAYAAGKAYSTNANLVLYAQWKTNAYTVTYNGNGATGGSTASQTFNHGGSVKIASNGFIRTDYTFTGWNTKADGTGTVYEAGNIYNTNANLTLYAQWEESQIKIPITIIWDDENNNIEDAPNGVRPKNVILKLMNGNTVVKTATVTGNHSVPATSNTWNYTFTGLNRFDSNGNVITYKVVEEQPSCLDGSLKYKVSYSDDTFTITNELVQPDTTEGYKVIGTITWLDEENKYHFRPDSVIIDLYQNGVLYDSIEVLEGTTTYEFTGLKKRDNNHKLYKYEVIERIVDNYSITYNSYETSVTETDSLGNNIITTTLHCDITNTFKPESDRVSNNILTMKTTYLDQHNNIANTDDFNVIKTTMDEQQVFVTLKKLDMNWKPVDATNGIFSEEYLNTYSGDEIKLILYGTDTTTVSYIPCGKYEIIVSNSNDFSIKNIEEINSKNAVFSYENGKYYVTYSYEYEEAKEDLNVNVILDAWKGYTSVKNIKNLYQLFLKRD